jgi:beta-glucanase (GH16 family)
MRTCFFLLFSFLAQHLSAQTIFNLKNPDYKKSPHTGMTRQHWRDAALYLLDGAFHHVNKLEDPMVFPKQAGKSYPREAAQNVTEKLEGFSRTLFFAASLLKEEPELRIRNIRIGEYYRFHLLELLNPSSQTYIKPRTKEINWPTQTLVELGAISVSLFAAPEQLWDPLTKLQQDALAYLMLSYADGPTVASNWKFFNIFIFSFFKSRGYSINESLMEEYLQKSLDHYRGYGWYNDAPAYDYYSMWAFQMYGPLWAHLFGNQFYPVYAQQFINNFKDVQDNYPYLFSRDGKMILWGRSMSYRLGSVIPFPLMGLVQRPGTNYGWMRRIASGVLLQFLQHPDFLEDHVPTLGFYGAFEPAVQPYSCRGSAYWMGKAFLGLLVPADNPFWTSIENEGPWEKELKSQQVVNKFQPGSNILLTDYPGIGASEIRSWCHVKAINAREPFRASENYNRLSYNSAFPWQADSVSGAVAMNYIVKNARQQWEPFRLYRFKKFEEEVYYRDVILETDSSIRMQLADMPLSNGILRIDRNMSTIAAEIRLGHYALPAINGKINKSTRRIHGIEVRIIDNGNYQLAMIPLSGWDSVVAIDTRDVHPEAKESTVLNARNNFRPKNSPVIYATLLLWKKSGEEWTTDELVPVKSVKPEKNNANVRIRFRNGLEKLIRFEPAPPPVYKNYELVWSDEFNSTGRPDSTKWSYEYGFVRNNELQWYQPENAYCENGLLVIEAKRETKPNPYFDKDSKDWRQNRKEINYTSSCLITKGKTDWLYGRFEMRARIDISAGLWPAWWTLGISKPWPANGEIDIMEYYKDKLLANIACLGADKKPEWFSSIHLTDSLGGKKWAAQFHTWRMDWDEKYITLYVDNQQLLKAPMLLLKNQDGSGFNPFKQPHYMLLNLAIGGMNGGDPSGTSFPRRMEVDYVRVWKSK